MLETWSEGPRLTAFYFARLSSDESPPSALCRIPTGTHRRTEVNGPSYLRPTLYPQSLALEIHSSKGLRLPLRQDDGRICNYGVLCRAYFTHVFTMPCLYARNIKEISACWGEDAPQKRIQSFSFQQVIQKFRFRIVHAYKASRRDGYRKTFPRFRKMKASFSVYLEIS